MGLFDRFRRNNVAPPMELKIGNAYNANAVQENLANMVLPYQWTMKFGDRDYAKAYLWAVVQRIFNAMKNVTYSTKKSSIIANGICQFVERNATLLQWSLWENGYAVIFYDKDFNYRLPYPNELRFDAKRTVTNKRCVVLYSDKYAMQRRTDFGIIKPELERINTYTNADTYLSANPAPLAIISGEGVPMNPKDKEELNRKMKKDYGLHSDDFQFMWSNAKLNVDTIDLPIDKLKLTEKAKMSLEFLCQYFCVPIDLVFGKSTYANMEEAKKAFYRDCIMPISEGLLKLARMLFVVVSDEIIPSSNITYTITNAPEVNNTLSAVCAERTAYLDYLIKLSDAGVDVDEEIRRLGDEARTLLTEV